MRQFLILLLLPILACGPTADSEEKESSVDPVTSDSSQASELPKTNPAIAELLSKLQPDGKPETMLLDYGRTEAFYFDGQEINHFRMKTALWPQTDGFWYALGATYQYTGYDPEGGYVDDQTFTGLHFSREPVLSADIVETEGEEELDKQDEEEEIDLHPTGVEIYNSVNYMHGGYLSWEAVGSVWGGAHPSGVTEFELIDWKDRPQGKICWISGPEVNEEQFMGARNSLWAGLPESVKQRVRTDILLRKAKDLYLDYEEGNFLFSPPEDAPPDTLDYYGLERNDTLVPSHLWFARKSGKVYLIAIQDWFAPYAASGDYEFNTHSLVGELSDFPKLFPAYHNRPVALEEVQKAFPKAADFMIGPGQNFLVVLSHNTPKGSVLQAWSVKDAKQVMEQYRSRAEVVSEEWARGSYAKTWWEKATEINQ